MLTAMAFDALGSALEPYTPKQRVGWFNGERVVLKRNARRVGTFNTQFMLLILQTLAYSNPVEIGSLSEFETDLKNVLNYYVEQVNQAKTHNRYILLLRGEEDTGLTISIGMAIGYYGALLGGTLDLLPLLDAICDHVSAALRLKSLERRDVLFYAMNVSRLVRAGYFCREHLEEMLVERVVPKNLEKYVHRLVDEHQNMAMFAEPFSCELADAKTKAQCVMAEVYYYMSRINIQSGPPSNPRQQLNDIFGAPVCSLTDLAFVFGGVCTVSEQNYTLLPNTYRENVGGAELVDELMNYVWPIV